MRTLLRTLALLCLAVPAAAQAQLDPSQVQARLWCVPERVEVGQPFDLVLELRHPLGADVFDVGDRDLELDDSWVEFGRSSEPPQADGERAGRALTRRRWTLASLEPSGAPGVSGAAGSRSLADKVSVLTADPRVGSVDASALRLEVLGVLGEDEDAPRPERGFPAGFGQEPGQSASPWRWPALVAAALAWAALIVVLVRRWRRRAPRRGGAVRAPAEQLADWRAAPAETPEAVRERHYELTRLVRGAVDQGLARRPAAGRTDAEWLASLQLEDPLTEELDALFREAEAVKYAGNSPTSWALEESYARAQRALERVALVSAGAGSGTQGGPA